MTTKGREPRIFPSLKTPSALFRFFNLRNLTKERARTFLTSS